MVSLAGNTLTHCEKKRALLARWRWRARSQCCTPGVAGFYPPNDDTPDDFIPCTLSERHIEASCTSLEIDSKLTVKPLKTDEKVSTSEHNINGPEGTETSTGAHRASRVVSPFSSYRGLDKVQLVV
jgi:hypothetical protein